jgi:hypothetical protein
MANTIKITLDLDTKEAKADLKETAKDAKKSGKKAGDNFSDGFKNSIGGIGKVVAGVTALIGSIGAALTFRESILAAQAQEDAINQLNASLQISGKFTEEASRSFQEYASQLQSVTRFGDEVLLQTGALINSLADLDQAGLQRATTAAADFATALKIDITSASTLVAKALAGQTSALSRYGVAVKKGKTEAETLENVLTALESKFGGAAQKDVLTFSGSVQQLQNNFGDLLEEIGFIITKNPQLVSGIGKLSGVIRSASENVADFAKTFNVVDDAIIPLSRFGDSVIQFVVAPLELVGNIFRLAVDVINNGAATIVAAFGVVAEGYAELISLVAGENGLTTSLRTFAETSKATLDETAGAVSESFNKALDFPIAETLALKNEELRAGLQANREVVAEETAQTKQVIEEGLTSSISAQNQLVSAFGVTIGKSAELTKDAVQKQANQTASIIKGGFAKAISGGIQTVVKSIAQGEDAFAAFGKFLLSTFGDLAIQLGSFFIAEGIAVEALNAVSGTGAIAAGAALVALGTLLKSFSGSGGASSSASATAGGIGAGGGTTPETVPTAETTPDDIAERSPRSVVNIKVDTAFDADNGLARRLADIISEGGDQEGITINNVRSFA